MTGRIFMVDIMEFTHQQTHGHDLVPVIQEGNIHLQNFCGYINVTLNEAEMDHEGNAPVQPTLIL